MRYTKILILSLVVCFIFPGLLIPQDKDRQDHEKARLTYERAKSMIYKKEWKDAVVELKKVIQAYQKSEYLEESLYYLGYSMNKLSRDLANLDEQLETQKAAIDYLNELIENFKTSSWADDAKVLRIEIAEELVKKGLPDYRLYINGSLKSLGGLEALQSLEALKALESLEGLEALGEISMKLAEEAEEKAEDPELELKLVALDALMNMDEDKAYPILIKMAKEEENPKLRERAIFILSRSKNLEVIPLLVELATKDPNQKVRKQAIFWLGQKKNEKVLDLLVSEYAKTQDVKVKKQILFAIAQYKTKKSVQALITLARKEEDPQLKKQLIFWLGQSKDEEAIQFLKEILEK